MNTAEVLALFDEAIKHPLFTIKGIAVTAMDLATFAIFVVATLVASRVLRKTADAALHRRGIGDPGTHAITRRLIHYAVLILGLGTAINNLGIDLSVIFAAGAVLGVGLGFAFQNVAQNFISGLILLFERTIKPGDILEVEGRVVRVEDLRIRCTVARTRDDEQIIIPNSTLSQGTVTNFTMADSLYRVRVERGRGLRLRHGQVRQVLQGAAGRRGMARADPGRRGAHDGVRRLVRELRRIRLDRRSMGFAEGAVGLVRGGVVGAGRSGYRHRVPSDGRALRSVR